MSYYVRNRGMASKVFRSIPTKTTLGMGPAASSGVDMSVAAQNFARNELNATERPSIMRKVSWFDAEGRRQEKVLDYGEEFEYISYPHIQMWDEQDRVMVGVPVGPKGQERRYQIKVGQIVEVFNLKDLQELMRLYSFLDEVDGPDPVTAKIVRKNVEGKSLVQLGPDGVLPQHATAMELEQILAEPVKSTEA